jgi:hypothetical protein
MDKKYPASTYNGIQLAKNEPITEPMGQMKKRFIIHHAYCFARPGLLRAGEAGLRVQFILRREVGTWARPEGIGERFQGRILSIHISTLPKRKPDTFYPPSHGLPKEKRSHIDHLLE